MVDEFQDTNGAQLDLLFELLDRDNPNLMCVGDDDQSIYRFQGANLVNFETLTKKYPGIRTIRLKENYRSTEELIEISKRIIGMIPAKNRMAEKSLEAVSKHGRREISFHEFTTEEEELLYIIDKIEELKKVIEKDKSHSIETRAHPYNNIAVLVRKRSDILKVIDAFLRSGIPYATDGKEDISGEMRVKQLLDVLDLAYIDPSEHKLKDLALYKVLTADYLAIPQTDVLRLLNFVNKRRAAEKSDLSVLDVFLDYFSAKRNSIHFDKPERIELAASTIVKLLADSRTRALHAILIEYIKDTGIFRFILKKYSDKKILGIRQLRALASFVNMIKSSDVANPAMRLDDFMEELKTRKEHGMPLQGNLVTLTQSGVRIYTAHGSKGLEFHTVIIPFCLHNKNWPARSIPDKIPLPPDLLKTRGGANDKETRKELELHDETRLFYVAATRARSHLVFTASPTSNSVTSRYLNELIVSDKPLTNIAEESLIRKSLEKTDKEDPFIGTEEILKDMVGSLSLNPTRLNTYLTCKRKFLYNDLLKLPGPKKKSLVFGNCAHKALEETYRWLMEKGSFPDFGFFMKSFGGELKYQGVDKVMAEDCLNKAGAMRGWFGNIAKEYVVPVGLERKLLITIGDNIIFTGKYDKVEWEDERRGLVRIVDYKTGRPDEHLKSIDSNKDITNPECDGYLRQLVCYRLLYERDKKESRGRIASHGILVFTEPLSCDIKKLGYEEGQYVNKVVSISDDMVTDLERLIKNVWKGIKGLEFNKLPKRDKDKCGKCDFQAFCWE